jgi:hypothetical protein
MKLSGSHFLPAMLRRRGLDAILGQKRLPDSDGTVRRRHRATLDELRLRTSTGEGVIIPARMSESHSLCQEQNTRSVRAFPGFLDSRMVLI